MESKPLTFDDDLIEDITPLSPQRRRYELAKEKESNEENSK